jgi:hypothetical protein
MYSKIDPHFLSLRKGFYVLFITLVKVLELNIIDESSSHTFIRSSHFIFQAVSLLQVEIKIAKPECFTAVFKTLFWRFYTK